MENTEEKLQALAEIRDHFKAITDQMELEQEQYWNSLTPEQQLNAFCAIMRRVYKGELEEKRSYRGVLYGVFGWGPEAYMPAQMAGYLSIHNAIMPDTYDGDLLRAFCKQQNIEDAENKINNWFSHY